jgi:hypothetical protein
MYNSTVRGALRVATATLALSAALAGGTAAAGAAPLKLEPATDTQASPATSAPVAEEFTSTGSSTISASVDAQISCVVLTLKLSC